MKHPRLVGVIALACGLLAQGRSADHPFVPVLRCNKLEITHNGVTKAHWLATEQAGSIAARPGKRFLTQLGPMGILSSNGDNVRAALAASSELALVGADSARLSVGRHHATLSLQGLRTGAAVDVELGIDGMRSALRAQAGTHTWGLSSDGNTASIQLTGSEQHALRWGADNGVALRHERRELALAAGRSWAEILRR